MDSTTLSTAIKLHPKILDKIFDYGTAGFRTRASDLDHIVFRMGLLATLRSQNKNATIGVMITASHNPEEDNGVKLIDPHGEMLESSWESYASLLANVSDEKLTDCVDTIANETDTNVQNEGKVVFARDTRPSSLALSSALQDGVSSLGSQAQFTDFGVLTTPQLHYIVRCINSFGNYGNASENGYYAKLSTAFLQLFTLSDCVAYKPLVCIDGANGVGSHKMQSMLQYISGKGLSVEIYNNGSDGKLNHKCGADFVKVQQQWPNGLPESVSTRCASFDGDGDRIVYFYNDFRREFRLLDGDKITVLIAKYLSDLVVEVRKPLNIGVVQTAYANGASTEYITKVGLPIKCVATGVKHLHHAAQEFDIGVYFEANGHGTVVFKESVINLLRDLSVSGESRECRTAASRLINTVDLINETVGDAISDLLLIECILAFYDWNIEQWNSLYSDLPSRQLKVKVNDRSVIKTTDAERKTTSPAGLQSAIDQIVNTYSPHGRSFVRPSGTEDVVRVYAEADTQERADALAYQVSKLVFEMAGGVGEPPIPHVL